MRKQLLLFVLILFAHFNSDAQAKNLEFIRNEGQWKGDFLYKSNTGNGDVFLQNDGIIYVLGEQGAWDKIDAYKHGEIKIPPTIKHHAYKMIFENCLKATVQVSEPQKYYYNYFLGNDSSKWKSNIHPSLALDYQQLYKGIDLHLSSEASNLKYDFIVSPNADVKQIKLKIDGADKVSISKNGNLIIRTSIGEVTEMKPVVYQYIQGKKQNVDANYLLQNNTITFEFPNGYNSQQILIIDPTVVFCTFSGSTADNWGFTATYDAAGNMYTGGLVSHINGGSFPVSLGAFQTTYGGGTGDGTAGSGSGSEYECDMGIMKISSDGTTKIYATYLGGADNDQPHSMIVDKLGNLIIAGRTYSNNYPTTSTAFDKTANGAAGTADLVITKLNPLGTGLVGSTYLGGSADDCVNFNAREFVGGKLKHNYGDDARSEVIIDDIGNIYVAASTFSTNFPTLSPIQGTNAGGQDAVLVKMNPDLSTMLFGTYLGGSSDDAGYVLSLDKAQNTIFLAGGTMSSDFKVTPGTYKPLFGGDVDGYVVKITNGPSYMLTKGTYIGTANYDQVYGLAMDSSDNVYFMGQTLGGTFPVTAGVYSNPNSSQFIMKMDNNLVAPIYSTVYGSGTSTETNISPVAFLVDTCQNVYISGWGGTLGGSSFPNVGTTKSLPTTSAAIQTTTDGFDFYFIVFGTDATTLRYASYFGSSSPIAGYGEHVDGGTSRFDKNGIIYQAICGGCGGRNIPTTPGSLSPTNGSSNCNLAALKISFGLGAVTAIATVEPDSNGCTPFSVQFRNFSTNAKTYFWDFADGTNSTLEEPKHTFNKPGNYKVMLIAHNPESCVGYDTTYINIVVKDFLKAAVNLPDNVCQKASGVYFANTSTNAVSVFWDFGDGNTSTEVNPTHKYDTGTYQIVLIVFNENSCVTSDTFRKKITIKPGATADFDYAPKIPNPNDSIHFTNLSVNALSYLWLFGDGKQSRATNPSHLFRKTGKFKTCLVAEGFENCNDTICKDVDALIVTRLDVPTAFTPNGDGVNDVLYVRGAAIESLDFNVYNRWGELVFHSNSVEIGWNGTYNGKPQPMESYAYVLHATFINGESETKRGNITILE